MTLSISDNTEFKKSGSAFEDISFEFGTDSSKFTKKSQMYNKHVQEIPFHQEVNSGIKRHFKDFTSSSKKELADSRSTATFKMESADIHLSNQKNSENKIKSIKSFGISEPVSK